MTPTHGLYGAPIAAGWQTILADLSLILFMVTAAALANAPDGPLAPIASSPTATTLPHLQHVAPSPRGEPVGVWSAGPGAPPLAQWLAQQGRDPRLRATILVRHVAGNGREGLAQAEALVTAAGTRGAAARIVIEEGPGDSAAVLLAYDAE
ncbi:MAG: hypothetical protein ACKVOL_06645 [Novosphingobium sp.]